MGGWVTLVYLATTSRALMGRNAAHRMEGRSGGWLNSSLQDGIRSRSLPHLQFRNSTACPSSEGHLMSRNIVLLFHDISHKSRHPTPIQDGSLQLDPSFQKMAEY